MSIINGAVSLYRKSNIDYGNNNQKSFDSDYLNKVYSLLSKTVFECDYFLNIRRKAPKVQLVNIKEEDISFLVSKVNYKTKGIEYQQKQVGVNTYSQQDSVSPTEFTATFLDIANGEIADYFLKDDGKDIIPTDGTFLLPHEFYFNIELLNKENGKTIFNKDCTISGGISISYANESQTLLQYEINFIPIQG